MYICFVSLFKASYVHTCRTRCVSIFLLSKIYSSFTSRAALRDACRRTLLMSVSFAIISREIPITF